MIGNHKCVTINPSKIDILCQYQGQPGDVKNGTKKMEVNIEREHFGSFSNKFSWFLRIFYIIEKIAVSSEISRNFQQFKYLEKFIVFDGI